MQTCWEGWWRTSAQRSEHCTVWHLLKHLDSTLLFSSLLLLESQTTSPAADLPSDGSSQLGMNRCAALTGTTSMGARGSQRISTTSYLALVPPREGSAAFAAILPSQAGGEDLACSTHTSASAMMLSWPWWCSRLSLPSLESHRFVLERDLAIDINSVSVTLPMPRWKRGPLEVEMDNKQAVKAAW